jgi:hypothetical protein
MKDKLEQFIEDNRDSFDSFDLPDAEKVWGKIAEKRKGKQTGRIALWYLSRAAVVLVIFGLSYIFHEFVDRGKDARLAEQKMNDIYEQLPELKEAENYYTNLVSNKLEEMRPFLAENPQISIIVNADLMELDSVYTSLKKDLRDNVANEQIIEAMIQNYRLKLRILEELQLEIKNEKNTDNEEPKHTI